MAVNLRKLREQSPVDGDAGRGMARDARTRELDAGKLRRLRQACGWSQDRLAEEIKVNKKTIERWERGKPIFPRHLARLEELFKADLALAETPAMAATNPSQRTFSAIPDKERALLIHNVRRVWIDGVLGQSLAALRAVELDLEPRVDAVEHPWADVPMPSLAPAGLEANPSVERAFAFFGQALLILGAPGVGKTTLMLQLADVLLNNAESNDNAFVPVVFTLSSWAAERCSLQDWLVDELNRRYQIASGTARKWVDRGVILPLLDGLDEVPLENREACVAAINSFRAERRRDWGAVPILVCCRSEDYEALSVRLALQGALIVHPLDRDRVEDYLRQGEPHFAAAGAVLRQDPSLFALIDTPLMLAIFVQACQQSPAKLPVVGGCRQNRRKWLFDTYVETMFKRRGRSHQYTQDEAICWLTGLAALMRKSRQTVLYLEWMQPSCLPSRALINVAVLGPLLVSGLTTGLLFGFGAELVLGDERALWLGIALGTLGPVAFWLFGYGGEIKPVETLRWSRMALTRNWEKRAFGALLFGLFFGSFGWIISGRTLGIMLAALSAALFFLFFELPGRTSESRVVPNQGVRRSLASGIITGLIGTAAFGMLLSAHLNAAAGLAFGAGLGFVTGLLNGGHICIQHGILRMLLWRCGRAPLDYVHFLDFAAQLILLRKVGGGYMFIHALFQEHFAALLPAEAPVAQTAENEGEHRRVH